jgi:hypothetical protein
MLRRSLLFCALVLTSCDSGSPGALSLSAFEGPEGEAVVRHLIAHQPVIEPEVPKNFCVVAGPKLHSTSMEFVGRMSDLKVRFVSGEVLTMRAPDKTIIDPSNGLPPVTLQIMEIKRSGVDGFDVIAGWAWKKTFERRHYKLVKKGGSYEVVEGERIEGNFVPSSP